MLRRRGLLRALGTSLLAAAAPAAAELAACCPGRGDLDRAGRIAATKRWRARFDRGLLLAWGTDELRTATPFTDGVSDLLRCARLASARILGCRRHAMHDPCPQRLLVTYPIEEVRAYPVLLALDRDGAPCRCASAARSGWSTRGASNQSSTIASTGSARSGS